MPHSDLDRPGGHPLELPSFEAREEAPGAILPPLALPQTPDTEGLSGGVRVYLREVRVVGNTALSDRELEEVTSAYIHRQVTYADLIALTDALTLAYANRGYVSSGAVLPEQSLSDEIVEIQIVEGELAEIDVTTDGRFRPQYFERRIARAAPGPVNIHELERRLQILQLDPRIRGVDASLLPGKRRGEAILKLDVNEERPYRLFAEANNYQVATTGAEAGRVQMAYTNLTGWGDVFQVDYTGSHGVHDLEVLCEMPITSWDTSFDLHMRRTWMNVVDDAFDDLGIGSSSQTYGFTLRQPVYRSLHSDLSLSLTAEYRVSQTYWMGGGFDFVAGPNRHGVARVTVLRLAQEYTFRSRRQVFAARSILSVGLPILNATDNSGNIPDGEFVAWLGQVQVARRVNWLDAQIIGRVDVQLSSSPLLGLERFAMGGATTVRGYRENTLVRDDGVIGSVELRVPVLRRGGGLPWLELAAFVDAGHSWDSHRGESDPANLVSVGLGARVAITNHIHLTMDWARDLEGVPRLGSWDLQDEGVHMALGVRFP